MSEVKSLSEFKDEITNALIANPEMFDQSSRKLLRNCMFDHFEVDKRKYVTLNFPKTISPDMAEGYVLKDGKGFISLSETFLFLDVRKKNVKKVSYVYRYLDDKTVYVCNSEEKPHLLPYKFHYDMDLNYEDTTSEHHPHHLQVLHQYPRFKTSEDFNVLDFLDVVRRLCFNSSFTPRIETLCLIK